MLVFERKKRTHFASLRPRFALAACTLMVAAAASSVSAQAPSTGAPGESGGSSSTGGGWLADRSRTQGPGFRVGDFELHPGVGVEVGWDENLYYSPDSPPDAVRLPQASRVDSGILRVTPHLTFSTLTGDRAAGGGEGSASSAPPTVTFQGGVSAAYYEFFADPNRRNLEVNAGLRLTILPQRPFGFSVYDTFSRQVRPFVQNINTSASMARDTNNAGLQLNFQTDGGVLQVMAGYDFGLNIYEDQVFAYGNTFTHTMRLQETYRFLPQTALIHDTSVAYNDYFNAAGRTLPSLLGNSWLVQTRIGLNGAITNNISLAGMIGYAAGFFADPGSGTYVQNYDAPIGMLQLSWNIVQGTRLALGYDRTFTPSVLGNYYSRDRGYASFSTLIGGVFMLGLDADVGYVDYGVIAGPAGSLPCSVGSSLPGGACDPHRHDIRVNASIFAEYRLTDWLGINTTLRYQGDITDYRYSVAVTGGAPVIDPASYNKFDVFLGVRVFY